MRSEILCERTDFPGLSVVIPEMRMEIKGLANFLSPAGPYIVVTTDTKGVLPERGQCVKGSMTNIISSVPPDANRVIKSGDLKV